MTLADFLSLALMIFVMVATMTGIAFYANHLARNYKNDDLG